MSEKSDPRIRLMDKAHGTAVRLERESRGWSQGRLATELRALGLTHIQQATVSRIEVGDQALRLGEACAIGRLFGYAEDPTSMFSGTDPARMADTLADTPP